MDPADTPPATERETTTQRSRRRASRAAGPAKGDSSSDAATVQVVAPAELKSPKTSAKKSTGPVASLQRVKPPPRRRAHRVLVGWISIVAAILAIGALVAGLIFLVTQQRHADAEQ